MRRSLGLYRRPSGIYAVRISVPKRLKFIVGKAEIHVSTGYNDSNSAIILAHKIQLYWREHLMALDEKLLKTTNPILQSYGNIYLKVAADLIGLDANALLLEFSNHRLPLFVMVDNLAGHEVEDIYDVERDHDGKFVLNDVEARGQFRSFTGVLTLYDSRRSIKDLIEQQRTEESTFRIGRLGAYFSDEELVFTIDNIQLNKADVESVRRYLTKFVLPQTTNPLALAPANSISTAVPPPAVIAPVMYNDPINAKHGHKKFSDLFTQYKKTRDWGLEAAKRMDTEAGLFIELMDDPNLASIDGDMVNRFAEELAKLPSNIYLAKRRLKLTKLSELIEVAAGERLALKQPDTIKGHVSKLSEILKYGVNSNMLHFNPASEFKRGSKRAFKKPQDDRGIFAPEELELIFSQEWFVKGTGEFTSKNTTHWRPFYYWLPLLGLFTGGRLNEISQLYLNDIKLSADEITYYFDFNLEGEGKIEVDDKSLKTVNSIRVVPINQSLIKLGFIKYVTALRESGESRLFPELRYDEVKGYGKAAGSWFNERFLGNMLKLERNGLKTFHSFRHTFLTELERLDITESVMAQLAGHQKGSTESMKRYVKDRGAQPLSTVINALNFDFIGRIKPFDVEAGLKALIHAKGVKVRIERNKGRRS